MRMSVTEYEVAESGVGEDRLREWEAGLPGVDDLMPLSQLLIPPDLASAFIILPEPYRTILEVNRASRNTLSSIRCQSLSSSNNFKSFNEDRDDLMVPETLDGPMVSEPESDRDVPGSGSDSRKSRKLDSGEESDSAFRSNESTDESSARTLKRPRLVWTPQLHKRFIEVVDRLGIKNAVPKTIMQLMNVEGLTRENVASHLQKYRIYLKRRQGSSSEVPSSPDHSFALTQVPHEPAVNNGHVAAQIPMPYQGHVMPMPLFGVGHVGMPFGNPNGYLHHLGYNWSPMVSYPQAARTDN